MSMEIRDVQIDHGKAFDWGRTSEDYAKYRDIYPEQFYQKLTERGLCLRGQRSWPTSAHPQLPCGFL